MSNGLTAISSSICLLICLWTLPLLGQSRAELLAKRKRLSQQIAQTASLLDQTASNKSQTVEELASLQKQLEQRQELLEVLEKEQAQLAAETKERELKLAELQGQLSAFKASYKKVLVELYKTKKTSSYWGNWLSFSGWSRSYRQSIYLKELEEKRRRQALLLQKTADKEAEELAQLEKKRIEQEQLLIATKEQQLQLEEELSDKDQLLKSLKRKEGSLRQALKAKERQKKQLNRNIEAAIQAQMLAAKKKARVYEDGGSSNSYKTSSNQQFKSKKGKLPAPVSGSIIAAFGRRRHPLFEEVYLENNGVDYRTAAKASVRSIADGRVVSLFEIPGSGKAILVQHANYYSSYAHIQNAKVKAGQKVSAGQQLAEVSKDPQSGTYILHFELWEGKKKLNPQQWLRP
ncbi:murein hydrolase activator EnvC family protein [Saprospira grandis]|uniref:murein hydrolase activator EnvC family protein n=1 Tax=Saprospira grandis TaxID=1008 RepID=UPI0022DD75E2|nr:peptidoglycan DD-metalloendopeptidase family protein [Saprospira grandis]WBM73280.1 peptidoglycan DD-metalloendopeptidase family protein [Saprospira grandis]